MKCPARSKTRIGNDNESNARRADIARVWGTGRAVVWCPTPRTENRPEGTPSQRRDCACDLRPTSARDSTCDENRPSTPPPANVGEQHPRSDAQFPLLLKCDIRRLRSHYTKITMSSDSRGRFAPIVLSSLTSEVEDQFRYFGTLQGYTRHWARAVPIRSGPSVPTPVASSAPFTARRAAVLTRRTYTARGTGCAV